MHPNKRQEGAVLIVTLVILTIVMVFGMQIATRSDINKSLVENETQRQRTEQYAQNVANEIMSDVEHFIDSSTALASANNAKLAASYDATDDIWTAQYDGYDVEFTTPECLRAKEVAGYSLAANIVPWTNYWTYTVTVIDPVTGASSTLNIGTKFNYTSGNCV